MKEFLKLVVILTVICTLAGGILAFVYKATKEQIKLVEHAASIAAINQVLPPCDNVPAENTCTFDENGKSWTFYVARKDGQFAGAAFKSTSSKGYAGDIAIMTGINAQGNINALVILDHKETPGLGANIQKPGFKSQFTGKSIKDTVFKVKKDGGAIDQITAATISSRAVCDAVSSGLTVFKQHEIEITNQGK